MRVLSIPAIAMICIAAQAQSDVHGIDLRQNSGYTSNTGTFVSSWVNVGPNSESLYAIDYDAAATTLWAIDDGTLGYGTIDPTTGTFTTIGTSTGIPGASGLTASPDGNTWYVCEYVSPDSFLYVGDVTTGTFSLVGLISGGIMIDIAMDSNGNLYGHNISDDSLYRIDTVTGAGTMIGATGQAANFAQGMDFDWSTDTLYAAVYTGGGTGGWCTMDLATGFANVLEDTVSLNAEMEVAIVQGSGSSSIGTNYCAANTNSTGAPAIISAAGSTSIADNSVTLSAGPVPNQPYLFFHANTQAQIPFGNGFLCAVGTIVRLNPPAAATGNVATRVVDLPSSSILAPGSYNFQCWFRDPAGGGAFYNTSDGLEIVFVP